jgi:amino acid permease
VILNLPNSMAKAGLPLGTFFQLWAAIVSLYTLWLLSHLYQEFKRRAVSDASVGLLPVWCWALGLWARAVCLLLDSSSSAPA